MEYFENRQVRKSMKLKAGDGDRTRDVQLGNAGVVCFFNDLAFSVAVPGYQKRPSFHYWLWIVCEWST
jgi:hypothetical protein